VILTERNTLATVHPIKPPMRAAATQVGIAALFPQPAVSCSTLVLGSQEMQTGVHMWEVQVLSGERAVIGVYCEEGGLSGWNIRTGRIVQDGFSVQLSLGPSDPGDLVTVVLDCNANHLSFRRNGTLLNLAPIPLLSRHRIDPLFAAVEVTTAAITPGRIRIRSCPAISSAERWERLLAIVRSGDDLESKADEAESALESSAAA
jgi:hypothetical protein